MSEADKNFIESLNVTRIKILLTKKYKHFLSLEELTQIDREADLIYRMIKEDKEYLIENGKTYHLSKDIKEFLKKQIDI